MSERRKTGCKLSFELIILALVLVGCARRAPQATTAPATAPVMAEGAQSASATVVVAPTGGAGSAPTATVERQVSAPAETLLYPLDADPQTLDPQAAIDDAARLVVQQLYEGLFTTQEGGGSDSSVIAPAAATGYQAAPNGQTYTITLRSGLQWSDGTAVTAQQYVDGACRALDPARGNSRAQQIWQAAHVRGAAAYASGAAGECAQLGVEALDPRTIRLSLEAPSKVVAGLLASQSWLPVRLDVVDEGQRIAAASNGPFVLAEWQPRQRVILVKNPHYWNQAVVPIQRIEFQILPDPAAQLAAYREGKLHVVNLPDSAAPGILAQFGLTLELHSLIRPGTSYLALNTQSGPTADVNVRRAIASAIDRQSLIKDVLHQPWLTPAHTLVPPDVPGNGNSGEAKASLGYPYDLTAARSFLAQAGYGTDNPPPTIELWTNREGNNLAVMAAVADMLEKAGLPTRLVSNTWGAYLADLGACNSPTQPEAGKTPAECSYNVYRMGWVMEFADPGNFLGTVFSPGSTLQYSGWHSQQFDELLGRATQATDAAESSNLYRSAERLLLNDEVVAVPLWYYARLLLIKQGVKSDYPPFGPPSFQYWKLP